MATKTPIAAGGNWSAGATWGGSAPTAADDVTITATLTGTLTIDGTSGSPNVCRSLDATGNLTGTLAHASAKQLNVGDGTTGKFLLVTALTYTPATDSVLKFISTTTGNNITTAAKRMGTAIFDGVGGSWTFQDAWDNTSLATVTLTNGTLNTNGNACGSTAGFIFSSSNSNTRALTLGASTISLLTSGTLWDIGTSTGMTLSAASSTINCATTTLTQIFNGGGLTYGTFNGASYTTGSLTINGVNTFSTLTLNSGGGAASSYIFGADQTVSGIFTSQGNSVINRVYLRSDARGTARTISAATFTFTNLDMQDITKAGAGSGNISGITGNSGDCGGNTGWTFTTPATSYWVPSGGTSTGSMSAVTRWANASGGTAGTGRSPLPQDTAVFNASSIDAGSRIITQDKPRLGAIDWTGATNTPTWAKSTACSFFGSITMVSGMTNSTASAYTYEGRSNSTFTTAGLTWTNALIIDCVNGQGTLTQGDNFTSSASLSLTSGTWAGASTYTTSFTSASLGSAATNQVCTFTPSGNMTLSAGLTLNTGVTVNSANYTITGGTAAAFSGGISSIKGFSGTTFTQTGGAHTIGTTGITCTTFAHQGGTLTSNGAITCSAGFSKTLTGTLTINAASTVASTMTFSGTGTVNLNANLTGSSTLSNTGANVTIGAAILLTYNNGYYAGGGGGASGGSFTFGS